MSVAPPTSSSPPATAVPHNRWDLVDVPSLGAWQPTRRVSVILPYYEAPDALELTLAAFAEQTYPTELLEIIVADDGSDPPAVVPPGLDELDIQVVHQEDLGFGLARARNTGAKAATGDILVFVDCDMVPEPQHVEAHARWHHAVSDAVTLGFRKHVEYGAVNGLDAIRPGDVRTAARGRDFDALFAGRDVQVPAWIEGHMSRTAELTSGDDDLFRVVTGGNVGMRAETFWRVGGYDESFTQWGAEDTELGYRLFVDGALVVPERAARCWHQGHGHAPEPHEEESLEQQRAKLAHLIAHRGFRSGVRGRTFLRPRVAVRVAAAGVPRQTVAPSVDAILGSSFHDLRVLLSVPDEHPDAQWLERQFGPDPRVEIGADPAPPQHTPIVVDVPADVQVPSDLLGTLVAKVESTNEPVGAVHVSIPGSEPTARAVHAHLTRAWRRAQRVVGEGADRDQIAEAVGRLFDERWLSGAKLGLGVGGVAVEPQISTSADGRWADGVDLPPARVPHNRWDLLEPADLGQWTPTRRVSLVLPHYDAHDALRITLAALAQQTYPLELLEVIVADDGSDRPPTVPPELAETLDVRITTQERRGFGAARARNLGARLATGDILVFLDADMVPEPRHVEAHARWHHVAADLVTCGFRKHADFDHLTPENVRDVLASGGLETAFHGRTVDEPAWIEGHMSRTSELRSADDDLFRVVTSGNLGVRAETFWRVGGFDETFDQWGGEDTELGYRLFNDGAVLVPERAALCWHQGHGHEPESAELVSLEDQRARLAHLIPNRGFRRGGGRSYERPRVVVEVDAAEHPRDQVAACVDSVLGSEFHDVVVHLRVAEAHPARVWLERQYEPDPRVLVARERVAVRHTPIRIAIRDVPFLDPGALGRVVALLESPEQPLGALHATVFGEEPNEATLHAWRTRAERRADRVAAVTGADRGELLAELFGERWISGAELGVRAEGAAFPEGSPGLGRGVLGGVTNEDMQAAFALFASLEPGTRDQALGLARQVLTGTSARQRNLLIAVVKRALMVVAAVGKLISARDARSFLGALSAGAKAVLPWSLFQKLRALARRALQPLLDRGRR